jgi:Protein of unknown function (DUF2938)
METHMDYAGSTLFIGAGATLATDLWAIARGRLLGVPAPNWGLVGRWFAHMARGRFRHERIATAEPVRGERVIGWTAHYLIGIAFAGALLAIGGPAWARQPTLAPALALGIATVAAPFLLMQPGMGAGIAASRAPRPNAARVQSLVTHAVFGLGLYAAGLVLNFLSGE